MTNNTIANKAMSDKEFKFKTNINCGACVASVKPHLDNVRGIAEWAVDTAGPAKILTVKSNGATPESVVETVEKAGYKIERLP